MQANPTEPQPTLPEAQANPTETTTNSTEVSAPTQKEIEKTKFLMMTTLLPWQNFEKKY